MCSQILCSLGNVNQNPTSSTYWTQQLDWFKVSPKYKTLDVIDGEPMEFEWNIFPGLSTLQPLQEVQKFMNKMSGLEQFQRRIICMLMFNVALKQCLKMQNAHLTETEQSLVPIRPQHQQRQRQNQQFERGENFDYCVDRETGWWYRREPRGNPPAAFSSSCSSSTAQ